MRLGPTLGSLNTSHEGGNKYRATLALAIAAAGCASPEAAFVGQYLGTNTCSRIYDDGTRYNDDPVSEVVAVELATDGSIYVAGTCTAPLAVLSTREADVVAKSCPTADGYIMINSGFIALDEPQVAHHLNTRVSPTTADPFWVDCYFVGTRVE